MGVGPSGWYGMNTLEPPLALLALEFVREGSAGASGVVEGLGTVCDLGPAGELLGRGIIMASWRCAKRLGSRGCGVVSWRVMPTTGNSETGAGTGVGTGVGTTAAAGAGAMGLSFELAFFDGAAVFPAAILACSLASL